MTDHSALKGIFWRLRLYIRHPNFPSSHPLHRLAGSDACIVRISVARPRRSRTLPSSTYSLPLSTYTTVYTICFVPVYTSTSIDTEKPITLQPMKYANQNEPHNDEENKIKIHKTYTYHRGITNEMN